MNTNPKYNPEDLEDLLLHKSFDELLESEQEFVLQHIDSIKEYKELRNTLLSIKDYSQNEEQIIAEPIVKEKLLQLFEKENRKPFYWLNSIGVFLFPANTSLFKKPAFQLATFAVLALFVVNIGTNLSPNLDENLAQKVTASSEETKVLNSIPEAENKVEETKNSTFKDEIKVVKEEKATIPTPKKLDRELDSKSKETNRGNSLSDKKSLKYKDLALVEKVVPVQESKGYFESTKVTSQETELAKESIKTEELEEDSEIAIDEINKVESVSLSNISLSSNVPTSSADLSSVGNVRNDTYFEVKNTNSQSLENEAELIDLLYVTM